MWLANGSMANFLWSRSTERKSDKFKRPYTHGGKRKAPSRFRTLMASRNMSTENIIKKLTTRAFSGAQRQRTIVLDRRDNSEMWKAMRGFVMAASKTAEADVVWRSKGSTRKGGWQSVLTGLSSTWFSADAWVSKTSICAPTEFSTTDGVCRNWAIQSDLVIILWACLWTTLRAIVDGQTCQWPALRNFANTSGVPPGCVSTVRGTQCRVCSKFCACFGWWMQRWWLTTAPMNWYLWLPGRGRMEKIHGSYDWQNMTLSATRARTSVLHRFWRDHISVKNRPQK